MANKNDLRFVKTERLIEETYMKLRRSSHRGVTVAELCKTALINKSTFYAHYETIAALHEHICTKETERILESCPHVDDAFSDTGAFVHSLVNAIFENREELESLFRNDRDGFTNTFENGLLKRYLHGTEPPEAEMKIVFAIGGAARLLFRNHSAEQIDIMTDLIKKVL